MKCPKCGGNLQYVEEVSGSFVYPIDDNGVVDFDNKEFYGNSWTSVECAICESKFDYDWNEDSSAVLVYNEIVFHDSNKTPNKNGFFKCNSCGNYQHTTEFYECSACGSDDLTEVSEAEFNKETLLPEEKIEELAKEIRQFLIDNNMWVDVRIYFNGKAFATDDGKNFYYNDPEHLVVLENMDPKDYFDYVAEPHILSMSFEGDFCSCLNGYGEYGAKFDDMIQQEFSNILAKYGLYYELGNHWNLTCYPV